MWASFAMAPGLSGAARTLRDWAGSLPGIDGLEGHELHSMLTCARLATEAALRREESRGAHFRADYPEPQAGWRRHIVFRKGADEKRGPAGLKPAGPGLSRRGGR